MSNSQFEEVVAAICRRILGAGTARFASGKDGGRDARFLGTAAEIPSKASPWTGCVVVQAKHTEGINKSCSDPDFFSATSDSCVVAKEIDRIKTLRKRGELDHYMIFTNRRLTAIGEKAIVDYIVENAGVARASILVCGIEHIEDWLRDYPEIAESLHIDPIDYPLKVDPSDLATVVEALASDRDVFLEIADFERVSLSEKNRINGMSEEYASLLTKRFLKYTDLVKDFLSAPSNAQYLAAYEDAADDFQMNVVAKRREYQSFDEVMNRIRELLFSRDSVLRRHRKLTSLMLFYMYWNCDLGLKAEDAEAV